MNNAVYPQQGDTLEIAQVIEQLLEREDWQAHQTFLHHLQAIFAGDHNPAPPGR